MVNSFFHHNVYWYLEFLTIIIVVYYATFESSKPRSFLLIGIFSSPENFEKRHSQRETWLKLAGPGSSVTHYFVLGHKMCPIPIEQRINPYGCKMRPLLKPSVSFTTFLTTSASTNYAEGFGFVATYDLTITHVGVPKCLTGPNNNPLRIKVKDGFDGKTLASATLDSSTAQLKAIRPVLFPRHSEGVVVIEGLGTIENHRCCSRVQKEDHGAIAVTNFVKQSRILPVNEETVICPFFSYKINENYTADDIKIRRASWDYHVQQVYDNIKKESDRYQDLILVNSTDFYRNLPEKLIHFLTKIDKDDREFEYVLKTDDDTIVDLRRVLVELRDPWTEIRGMWWWSQLKEYWNVPRLGKWREEKYKSVTYPPFPCGGGYVLNRATVRHLAGLSEDLTLFNGEDVSLGIWLSSVNIHQHKALEHVDRSVSYKGIMTGQCEDSCQWTCDSKNISRPRCNIVQLSVIEMFEHWEALKRIGLL